MYIFTYNAKNPTKYSYKGEDIYFADSLPVVLMTGETQSTIRGINLNFCNKALKTLILNILQEFTKTNHRIVNHLYIN